jgi:hypothetical protein
MLLPFIMENQCRSKHRGVSRKMLRIRTLGIDQVLGRTLFYARELEAEAALARAAASAVATAIAV